MRKNIIFFIVTGVVVWFNIRPYLQTGFPYTHDGENHLARFANYKIALREGQLPPRFAPNLVNHFGYPVFNYNYPLANILSLPFSLLKVNYEVAFKLLIGLSLMIGMVGMWRWLSTIMQLFSAKIMGLIVFATHPYWLNMIAFRGTIGEVMALALLPWQFWMVEECRSENWQKKRLNLVVMVSVLTLFLLSHNVTVVFSLPLLLLYAVVRFGRHISPYKILAIVTTWSVLLSLWFWLPAIAEKNQITIDQAQAAKDYLSHFVTIKQLLLAPLTFGYSYAGVIDSMSFNNGLMQSLLLVLGMIVIIKTVIQKKSPTLFSFLTVTVIGLLWLQTEFSAWLWQAVPLSRFVQFPWRLGIFVAVLTPALAGWLWPQLPKIWKWLLITLFVIQISALWRVVPIDYFHKNNVDYDAFGQSTTTLRENLPTTFTYIGSDQWSPSPQISSGRAEISDISWSGSARRYKVIVIEPVIMMEPTMYFLGWKTKIKPLNTAQQWEIPYINSHDIGGRITYQLEPGEYEVETSFTQQTWARITGNTLSFLAGVGIFVWLGVEFYRYKKRRSATSQFP